MTRGYSMRSAATTRADSGPRRDLEDPRQVDGEVFQARQLDRRKVCDDARLLVAVAGRLPVGGQLTPCEIDEPHRRDGVPRVQRDLDLAVVAQARLRDLDEEQHVRRAGVRGRVEVVARVQERDVGLGLGARTER